VAGIVTTGNVETADHAISFSQWMTLTVKHAPALITSNGVKEEM
jgi:hypothetical protein